jgi:hypothetical protein
VWYCSRECQRSDWRSRHKLLCKTASLGSTTTSEGSTSEPTEPVRDIPCVMLHCTGDGRRYEDITVPSADPIFTFESIPLMERLGYPLVMRRTHYNLHRSPDTDNQHATWLNINPSTGWAPDAWQHSIGNVIVANPDKTPLTSDTLAAITDYVSDILDVFGEEGAESVAERFYGPRRRELLDEYIADHEAEQARYRESMEEFYEGIRSGSLNVQT